MPPADPGAHALRPADVERWLADLGMEPVERAERDGIASWDLVLDGRRRSDLRVTVILDPELALICWAHYAPPINDAFRKSYRRLLRWNDEFPLAKFSISEDDRPGLAVERSVTAAAAEGADGLGLALMRIVDISDRLLDESRDWLTVGGPLPERSTGTGRNEALLARFQDRLGTTEPPEADDAPLATAEAAP